ncbi:hypothetical protein [Paractinoplanes toevensis]|uniref:Uncharacterized protein n=1 Tax=Paractinoplanes toevensis TaxID=571911 RepID=A0A919VZG9_9ACTN|nr:hypothetical protein [Actinoplanes toevensis]GIM90122.1 hypothetical protein Ato02nite_019150 [Actinoplanes toevensis]
MQSDMFLIAALVPADTTVDTIDTHLAGPMQHLMPNIIDKYRLGGMFTGIWDPTYTPQIDPANWQPCEMCEIPAELDQQPCPHCSDAESLGRHAGTLLAGSSQWKAHPGDIVPLPLLLADWRHLTQPTDQRRSALPDIFVDSRGYTWLSSNPDGTTPLELHDIFEQLLTGQRQINDAEHFEPAAWSVAIVAGHRTADPARLVIGSVVLITDPDSREDDADPDQPYIISDDFDAYTLIRPGGEYALLLPGAALTEVDPTRLVLLPQPADTPQYKDILRNRVGYRLDAFPDSAGDSQRQ